MVFGPLAQASDVYIVPGSEVNLVARDGRIPITVKNDGSESAIVIVHGKSSSFRLEVLKETEITVPAGSSQLAELAFSDRCSRIASRCFLQCLEAVQAGLQLGWSHQFGRAL
jgi:hypothetical protein